MSSTGKPAGNKQWVLDYSDASVHDIIHNMLQYQKFSAKWVPKQLTPNLKERCVMFVKLVYDVAKVKGVASYNLFQFSYYGWMLGP